MRSKHILKQWTMKQKLCKEDGEEELGKYKSDGDVMSIKKDLFGTIRSRSRW